MAATLEGLREGLAGLERAGLARARRVVDSAPGRVVAVDGREVLNFSGNDYLGLAGDARLRAAAHAALDRYGTGSGASPLVSGHQRPHDEVERRFARFCGLPRALLFGSGYLANLGILTALCDRHAEIFADRLNHACLNDGALLSRARFTRYPHGDVAALERQLRDSPAPVRVVATDAVFSMDGDVAPLEALASLCGRYGAWLVIDDAHGLGVLGARGRGALERFALPPGRLVYMATLGKALGGYGAIVAAGDEAIEWLLQRARTYVYSTALPAAAAASAIAALDIVESAESPVPALKARIAEFRELCAAARLPLRPTATAIQPLVLGEPARAVEAAARLFERGYWVPAIRPPTVPPGTARLRISLSAAHTPDDLRCLVAALAEVLAP